MTVKVFHKLIHTIIRYTGALFWICIHAYTQRTTFSEQRRFFEEIMHFQWQWIYLVLVFVSFSLIMLFKFGNHRLYFWIITWWRSVGMFDLKNKMRSFFVSVHFSFVFIDIFAIYLTYLSVKLRVIRKIQNLAYNSVCLQS